MPKSITDAGRVGVALSERCTRCGASVTAPEDPEEWDCFDEDCPYWPTNEPEVVLGRTSATDAPREGAAAQEGIAAGSGPHRTQGLEPWLELVAAASLRR